MKKSLHAVAASLAVSAFVPAGASVQEEPSVSNPTARIAAFSVETVGPVLNELGIAWQAQTTAGGQTYIAATVGGVLNFLLAPTACRDADGGDCVGLNMMAIFEGNPNPQTVRAFNYRYAFASAGIDPSGAAYLSRYELADYGIARGNVATSVMVFVNQVAMFANELDTAQRTVSLEGYADDLASSSLNRQVRETLTGVKLQPVNAVERHRLGLEDSAEAVRLFIRDQAAPRNKIENIAKD